MEGTQLTLLREVYAPDSVPADVVKSVDDVIALNKRFGHSGVKDETIVLLVKVHQLLSERLAKPVERSKKSEVRAVRQAG